MQVAEPLKLVALDGEDLAVVSAHVQDAVLKIKDLAWRPQEKRFALAMNRFDWEGAVGNGRAGRYQRRRSVLHFDRVLSVKSCRLRREEPEAVLEVLAIAFQPGEEPGGCIDIHLAGGGCIRLEVECIEARLTDLGAAWATSVVPVHDITDLPEDRSAHA
jgi:hypothetical protein